MVLIAGGLGAAKSELIDRPEAEKKRRSALLSLKFAPLKGESTQEALDRFHSIQDPDTLQQGLDWGMAGASFAQKNPGMFGGGESAAMASPEVGQLSQPQLNYTGGVDNKFRIMSGYENPGYSGLASGNQALSNPSLSYSGKSPSFSHLKPVPVNRHGVQDHNLLNRSYYTSGRDFGSGGGFAI